MFLLFWKEGGDTYVNNIGYRYVFAIRMNSQLLFWENMP